MANQEAIEVLKRERGLQDFDEILVMALDVAIKALEQEECEDAISRQAVIDAFWKLEVELRPNAIDAILNMVNDMPYVTPQPKTGHWIKVTNGRGGHECDICHEYAPSYQSGDEYLTKFCPNCGCHMVEPQESEDKE